MRKIIDYLNGLTLKGGDHDGAGFKVLAWEKRFITGAFKVEGDVALTVARGNGKSALVAALACCVVDPCGPLHGNRREVECVASSFEQSRTIFEDVLSFLGERFDLGNRHEWRRQDSANRATLEYRPTGARVRCLGSDPARAHGLRPYWALLDEPAQWERSTRDRMLAAIRTGLGKVPGSRLFALGTRPADSSHWFARLLESAPYTQSHTADPDADPFKVATWRAANPSLDHLPSLREQIEREARDAKLDPDALAAFRSLRLNLGMSDVRESLLVSPETWKRIEVAEPFPRRGAYVLGLDLGSTAAMSAAAGYWPESGAAESLACFPEVPSLKERGLRDGCGALYQRCFERSELIVAGQFVSDVQTLLRTVWTRWGAPGLIVCDHWREGDLREALAAVNFPKVPLVLRRMGFGDGAADCRAFTRAALDARVRPTRSLLLRAAMSEARLVYDAAGNGKMSKSTEGGRRGHARDDAATALVLATAEGTRRQGPGRAAPAGPIHRVCGVTA